MPVYVVEIKRTTPIMYRAVEAASPEEAVDKIIMQSEGSPMEWEVIRVEEVERPATDHDGPTEHVERGAISFT